MLVRIAGQRALAAMSSVDFAAAVAFGAIVGRVVLGSTPTLAAGVLGLLTLFALRAVFGRRAAGHGWTRWSTPCPRC